MGDNLLPVLDRISSLVAAFGAVGTLSLVIAVLMVFLYRKDGLLRVKEDREHMLRVTGDNAQAMHDLSAAVDKLARNNEQMAEQIRDLTLLIVTNRHPKRL
jgi:hypothetical protein